MNNISSIKSIKTESPKTPGGISKSLLTPCRRLGLSRKWKKSAISPFVSPLSSSQSPISEVKVANKDLRKRKKRALDVENEAENTELPNTPENDKVLDVLDEDETVAVLSKRKADDIIATPIRHVDMPRSKKSKLLKSALCGVTCSETYAVADVPENTQIHSIKDENLEYKPSKKLISTQITKKSTSRSLKPKSPLSKTQKSYLDNIGCDENKLTNLDIGTKLEATTVTTKPRSPNELTKECIVVLQKKIFKTDKKETQSLHNEVRSGDVVSQTLFDSDTDDVPLCQIKKTDAAKVEPIHKTPNVNEDFVLSKTNINTKHNLNIKKNKMLSIPKPPVEKNIVKQSSQSSNSFDDDDDDFAFDNRRTILICKTYDKVVKPLKAKSTGTITQKDIDDLKARIEHKKKLLLAKAMCKDTDELRGLIKKWQKGCQDALIELIELMKVKCADKQNLDYAEMLHLLKIPSSLVGYDSDNDCFISPSDANIILSKFNDL